MHVATKNFSVNWWTSFDIVSFRSSFALLSSAESSLTHMHYSSPARTNDIADRLCCSCAFCVGSVITGVSIVAYWANEDSAKAMHLVRQEQ